MDILVIHTGFFKTERKTVDDTLYCYERYTKGHRFFYLNIQAPSKALKSIAKRSFQGVIFHDSFLSIRTARERWAALYPDIKQYFGAMEACKVAMPQDEYQGLQLLSNLFVDCKVDRVYTLALQKNHTALYGDYLAAGGSCAFAFPGYVDENSLALIDQMRSSIPARDLDVGYRARNNPYWLGRLSRMKVELRDNFKQALTRYPDLTGDVETTGDNGEHLFVGNSWYTFMLRCRTMLGCMGGGSLLDPEGFVKEKVDAYVAAHPGAGFDEVEAACFPGMDNSIEYQTIGPRNFECAMTKTCQVLVEGDYGGMLQPGVHYIEVKRDFSNIDDVMEQIRDAAHCEAIAQRCYEDVVQSGRYTYARFANNVIGYMQQQVLEQSTGKSLGRVSRVGFWLAVRRYQLSMLAARAGQKLQTMGRAMYYTLCDFSDKHPRFQKMVNRLLGR